MTPRRVSVQRRSDADAQIDRFVTLDGSQEQAARELGLPV
jgi:hypothetical protein